MLPVRAHREHAGDRPASVAVPVVAASVTVGSTSSLTMVTVPLLGVPTVYPALALSVTTTVSSTSSKVSLIGVTVIVALAAPAAIVALPGKVA